MSFAEVLNDFLIENNLTKRKFAQNCNLTTSQITSFMRGAIPNINTAVKIADYMNCSVNYLMGIDEDKNQTKINNKGYDIKAFLARYDYALKLNKITHWKLSHYLLISESNIRGWKHGSMPKLETLIKIASYLNMSIDFFLGRASL